MIRVTLIGIFLGIYFLLGIIAWGVLWVIGLSNNRKQQEAALWLVKGAFGFILKVCSATKVTVIGKERIPKDTAVLYVGNHRSFFDILLIYTLVPDLTGFVAKKEMEKVPFLRVWMRMVNCLFLDRDDLKQSLQIVLAGIEKLKNGVSICIFPEGTRNEGEELTMLPFKEGSLKMAEKAGVPIIPVGINNTAAIFENQFPRVKRAHAVIEFGEPIYPKDLDKEKKKFLGLYTQEKILEIIQKNAELV